MKKSLTALFRLPYAPIFWVPLLLTAPTFLTGRALFWGPPSTQFVPWWHDAWRMLSSGHLPLWTDLVGMGAPLAANYQSAVFYPPYWFYFLLEALGGVPALAWGQSIIFALHLILAGWGMARLCRALGLGELAQAVGGLGFGLSGYIVSRGMFPSIVSSAAWAPWVLLAVTNIFSSDPPQARRLHLVACLAFPQAMQLLAGHAQTTWYTLLLAGLWAIYWSVTTRRSFPFVHINWRGWILFILGLGFAVALASIQLLPTYEYLLQSQRTNQVDYETVMTYSFWPWRLIGLVAPNLFGSPASGNFWGYATFWEDAIYIGLLPFIMCLRALSMVFHKSTHRNLAWFLLGVSIVATILAMGKNLPVFPWLYAHFPTFSMFKSPARFMLWVVLAFSILAGVGLDTWQRPQGRALYWARLASVGAFSITLGALLGWFILKDRMTGAHLDVMAQAVALMGIIALGSALLNLSAPPADGPTTSRSISLWKFAVVIWVSLDLLIAGLGLNPAIEAGFYATPSALTQPVKNNLGLGRLYLSLADEDQLKYTRFFRFKDFSIDENWENMRLLLLPNITALDEIPTVNNYDPLLPGRYTQWMETLEKADEPLRTGMLRLMNVSLVEKPNPTGIDFTPIQPAGRYQWYPCAQIAVSEADALLLTTQILSTPTLPGQQPPLIIETSPAAGTLPSSPACSGDSDASIQIQAESPNTILLHVTAPNPGWLMTSDTWYPGWRAWVDDRPATLSRANYLFRAVFIPAGEHTIQIAYRPGWFYLGASLSLIAWAGLLFIRFSLR